MKRQVRNSALSDRGPRSKLHLGVEKPLQTYNERNDLVTLAPSYLIGASLSGQP